MARQSRKHQVVKSRQGQGQITEEVFDDNLLPDASEIEKLHKIDPNILEWLKKNAEQEQKFRHLAYTKRLELVGKNEKGDRQINRMSLIFSFIILLLGLLFSAFLIHEDHNLLGSIFGGGILIAVVSSFLKKVVHSRETKNK